MSPLRRSLLVRLCSYHAHTNQSVRLSSDESRPLQPRRLAAPKATKLVGLYALSTPQIVVTASLMMASISARGMRARARIESVWRVADATRASRRGSPFFGNSPAACASANRRPNARSVPSIASETRL